MFKEFVWNAFVETGNLESYMFYKEIEERDRAAEQRNQAQEEVAPARPIHDGFGWNSRSYLVNEFSKTREL